MRIIFIFSISLLLFSCKKERTIHITATNGATGERYAGLQYYVVSSTLTGAGEKYKTEKSGFLNENGAVFIAKIDPTACQSSSGIITSSNHIDKLNEQILNFQKDNPDLGLEATSSDSTTSIDIYPNPTNGNIVVEINDANLKDCVIHIKDELGRLLLAKSGIHGVNTIDLSQLNKGVYFIEIIDKNTLNNFTTKIIYQ